MYIVLFISIEMRLESLGQLLFVGLVVKWCNCQFREYLDPHRCKI